MAHAEKRGKYWRVKYKLPNGKWGSASRDDFGNRFTTERSAEKYGHALETDVHRKVFINPRDGRMTVAEWAELWTASLEVNNTSEKAYRARLRTVILPRWADVPVGDILTIAYTTWEKELRTHYSDSYVKSVRSVFRTMMDDAVASKVRGDNPVPSQRAQRRGKFKGKPQTDDTDIATPRQALLVARNGLELRGLTGYVMVLCIAYMGLRISEMAGLRREHLVLEDNGRGARLMLQEQHQYVDGKPVQVDPKYGSSGDLVIPPFLAELLQQLLDSHKSEWVFTAPKGGKLLIGAQFYKDTWRPLVDGRVLAEGKKRRPTNLPELRAVAGVENLVPHGLRHSMKVWLDEGGHPRVAVEERMRHVLPGVEGVYSHTTLKMELAISEYLQGLWEDSLTVVVDRREWEAPRPPRGPDRS